MIKFICKTYLRFPPIVHRSINFSLFGLMNYAGIDYNPPCIGTLLLEVDEHAKILFL